MRVACLALLFVASACGDTCDRLCSTVVTSLADCGAEIPSWNIDAAERASRIRTCRAEWDRANRVLTSTDLDDARDQCREAIALINDEAMTCTDLDALYGEAAAAAD